MERLTKKFTYGTFYCEDIEDVGIEGINAPTYVGKAVNKLADYEDAEEQGLLLRLPCKVGDTVYAIVMNEILEDVVDDYDIWSIKSGLHLRVRLRNYKDYVVGAFGKDIFLTKEEAEQALKDMQGV